MGWAKELNDRRYRALSGKAPVEVRDPNDPPTPWMIQQREALAKKQATEKRKAIQAVIFGRD